MASTMLEIAGGDEEYASIQFAAFARPRLAHRTFNVSPGPSTLSTVLFIALSFALRMYPSIDSIDLVCRVPKNAAAKFIHVQFLKP
jgi:hypothetical protein